MSELKELFWNVANEKGFSKKTVEAFVAWYVMQDKDQEEKEFGNNLIGCLAQDYERNGWESQFSNARFASRFLMLGKTNNLDTLERLIQEHECNRRTDETLGEEC